MIFAGVPKFQNFEVVVSNENLLEKMFNSLPSLFALLQRWISLSLNNFFHRR
jgi:hypothetical protein